MSSKPYLEIVRHYEACLRQHGDTHKGVDWPNEADAQTRYQVMLDIMKDDTAESVTLLDFGCGASHLYEYILHNNDTRIVYSGLDISPQFIELSRKKFPDLTYYCVDVLDESVQIPTFDYIVMNGVFTEKRDLTFDEMFVFFQSVIKAVYPLANKGIAFNVMSKQVDWELDFLFHLPLDALANFLTKELTRDFVIRFDYKLYEYTTYIYRNR